MQKSTQTRVEEKMVVDKVHPYALFSSNRVCVKNNCRDSLCPLSFSLLPLFVYFSHYDPYLLFQFLFILVTVIFYSRLKVL